MNQKQIVIDQFREDAMQAHASIDLGALDTYFAQPPTAEIERAKARLRATLAEAEKQAILYGKTEHPTVNSLYLAIRKGKVIAINFGLPESEFIAQIEHQFEAPVYFDPDATQASLKQVHAYLNGQRQTFDLPTDISLLTEFQQQVLQATQQIPRGRIATYMDIARKIGKPRAVRAVGQALGRNPIPIVIPCHRVIASNGSLGGYSGGGGLETKARLLQLEGAMAI